MTDSNCIKDMCFTEFNSFILTEEGHVYSWGSSNACLGREHTFGSYEGMQIRNKT
jgi:alpha-tubulin suppressor-like RCC1 family protein